jgi:uncharacterized protein (DUF2164 family)
VSGTADPQVQAEGPPAEAATAPLNDIMLAMDVVDTLRHRQDLVVRELNAESREKQLIEKLREIYHSQGIEVPDSVLREGVAALAESRFVYTPPKPSFRTSLARLYVARGKWGPAVFAAALVLLIGFGGYFLAYRPYQQGQIEAARIELAETLPAQMDALYQTIFTETKVQQAVIEAEQHVARGKAAAAEGDREGALREIEELTAIRDQLRQEYSLRVVSREGVRSGFWTFPDINTEATNYYIVVEAIASDGRSLTLPIVNEENNETEMVSMWGLRVPEAVYQSVEADKRDDGIIQRNIVGIKQYGFLDVDYAVPVLGGAVTRW